MPGRAEVLQPSDVVVAMHLAASPGDTYEEIGRALEISKSSAYRSVKRLEKARLLVPGRREPMRHSFLEFLRHGVRHAFFAEPGREELGIPTAHSAPPLADEMDFDKFYVWPDSTGVVRGASVQPLYNQAPHLQGHNQSMYRALALVDAVRVGQPRERERALELLDGYLEVGAFVEE